MFTTTSKKSAEKDNKTESFTNPFNITAEEETQFAKLSATENALESKKRSINAQMQDLKQQLENIETESNTVWKKLLKFKEKPDPELKQLLIEKLQSDTLKRYKGVNCHADLKRQVIAIRFYPVDDLEAVRKIFLAFVSSQSIKISDKSLDGVSWHGGPHVFLEIDMKEREELLNGLKLAKEKLHVPTTNAIMC